MKTVQVHLIIWTTLNNLNVKKNENVCVKSLN